MSTKKRLLSVVSLCVLAISAAFAAGYGLANLGEKRGIEPEPRYVSKKAVPSTNGGRDDVAVAQDKPPFAPAKSVFFDVQETELDTISLMRSTVAETNPVRRIVKLARTLEGLDESNILEALALFEDLPPGPMRMQEMNLLMYAWGAFDGPAAVGYAEAEIGGRLGRFAAHSALSSWSARDPFEALAWSREQIPEGERNPYTVGIVAGWTNYDILEAADFVAGMPEGRDRYRSLGILASQFLQNGIPEATQWADGLPEDEFKESVFLNLARQWSSQDPESSADWVEHHVGESYSVDAIRTVASNWARDDPLSAVSWAAELPEGEAREKGVAASISRWAADDPNAAGDWLNEIPAEPSMDPAVRAFARRIAELDPEAALSWSKSIIDPELRLQSIQEVSQDWYRQDPQSASAWLAESELPSEVRESITNPPSKGDPRRRGPGRDFRPWVR